MLYFGFRCFTCFDCITGTLFAVALVASYGLDCFGYLTCFDYLTLFGRFACLIYFYTLGLIVFAAVSLDMIALNAWVGILTEFRYCFDS